MTLTRRYPELLSLIEFAEGKIPEDNIRDAYDYLARDEWGEIVYLICVQLYEYDVSVPRDILEMIEITAEKMNMDSELWRVLKK